MAAMVGAASDAMRAEWPFIIRHTVASAVKMQILCRMGGPRAQSDAARNTRSMST
jgi:hypothetical protein